MTPEERVLTAIGEIGDLSAKLRPDYFEVPTTASIAETIGHIDETIDYVHWIEYHSGAAYRELVDMRRKLVARCQK